MRTSLSIFVLVLVLGPLVNLLPAQDKPPGSTYPRGPEKIAGKGMSDWLRELRSVDPGVRENAIRTIQLFGSQARDAVPEVVNMLGSDRDISLRVNAAIALMNLEIPDREIPNVVRALAKRVTDDREAIVRFHAAVTLARFETEARPAIPSLISATRDNGSWEIRKAAVTALAKASKDKENGPTVPATSAVLKALTDPAAKVRLEAIQALGVMGTPRDDLMRQTVLRDLIGKLNERDKTLVVWTYVSLMALDKVHENSKKEIAKLLRTGDVPTRAQAAQALGILGEEAKEHVPDLISATKDPEASVAMMACWGLGEMSLRVDPGEGASKALTELTLMSEGDPTVKEMAKFALERIKGKKINAPKVPDPIKPKKP